MPETETDDETTKKKGLGKPLLLGLVLALVLGAGGFYAVWSGMILGQAPKAGKKAQVSNTTNVPEVAFVPIQPLIINVGPPGENRHLRFQAQLEVKPSAQEEVTKLLPRVVDVLNSYLRAVEASELEKPVALVRLRAQMLRRVQVVTGAGRVRDLLIMEFVLN